ncbi:MAG TPA: hypothetical protein VJ302_16185 [Blastocatellia bacterium]|nr:hypothetical protein [Blastocatellia bacterium]
MAIPNLRVEDHLDDLRDAKLRDRLAGYLKEYPEEERFQFIRAAIAYHMVGALRLANSCLRKREYFVEILELGLRVADASSILLWLQCVTPRLGIRRVVSILSDRIKTEPDQVKKALYWLPTFLKPGDSETASALRALGELADQQPDG